MAGVNKAIIVGHVGDNPNIRTAQSGARIASFSIATSEQWRDKSTGERKETTDWHRVVVFNEALVKVVEQYVKKGSKLYIEGAMRTRKWTDKGGVERYITEVVLGPFHSQIALLDRREGVPPAASADDYGGPPGDTGSVAKPEYNDEIPF